MTAPIVFESRCERAEAAGCPRAERMRSIDVSLMEMQETTLSALTHVVVLIHGQKKNLNHAKAVADLLATHFVSAFVVWHDPELAKITVIPVMFAASERHYLYMALEADGLIAYSRRFVAVKLEVPFVDALLAALQEPLTLSLGASPSNPNVSVVVDEPIPHELRFRVMQGDEVLPLSGSALLEVMNVCGNEAARDALLSELRTKPGFAFATRRAQQTIPETTESRLVHPTQPISALDELESSTIEPAMLPSFLRSRVAKYQSAEVEPLDEASVDSEENEWVSEVRTRRLMTFSSDPTPRVASGQSTNAESVATPALPTPGAREPHYIIAALGDQVWAMKSALDPCEWSTGETTPFLYADFQPVEIDVELFAQVSRKIPSKSAKLHPGMFAQPVNGWVTSPRALMLYGVGAGLYSHNTIGPCVVVNTALGRFAWSNKLDADLTATMQADVPRVYAKDARVRISINTPNGAFTDAFETCLRIAKFGTTKGGEYVILAAIRSSAFTTV